MLHMELYLQIYLQ